MPRSQLADKESKHGGKKENEDCRDYDLFRVVFVVVGAELGGKLKGNYSGKAVIFTVITHSGAEKCFVVLLHISASGTLIMFSSLSFL